jgi:hypothetical protein
MKPDICQNKSLKQYLRKALRYRETYEEVYDHLLSALESKPENVTFENAVNSIIQCDFGGYENLPAMEKNCKKVASNDAGIRQFYYTVSYFKFSSLFYLVAFSTAVYFILSIIPLGKYTIETLLGVLVFIPNFIVLIRHFNTGYVFGDTKTSMRDDIILNLAALPLRVFIVTNGLIFVLSINKSIPTFWNNINQFILMIIIVLTSIYTIAFFKLSNDEFETSIINS